MELLGCPEGVASADDCVSTQRFRRLMLYKMMYARRDCARLTHWEDHCPGPLMFGADVATMTCVDARMS